MKHGKRPTKSQRIFLQSFNLDSEDWLVVKDTNTKMLLVSRYTGRTKEIPKWRQ